MQLIQKLALNQQGIDFVVGDIHGYFDVLDFMLKAMNFDRTKDRLFAVGDLVDRGPCSSQVLDWLAEPWFYSVRGNHEAMIINAVFYNQDKTMHVNARSGGMWLYSLPLAQQREIAEAFSPLPYVMEVFNHKDKIALLHANVPYLGEITIGQTW